MIRIRPVYTTNRKMDLSPNSLILLLFLLFQVMIVSFLLSHQTGPSQVNVNILHQTPKSDGEPRIKPDSQLLGTSFRQDKRLGKLGQNKTFEKSGKVEKAGFNNSCLFQNQKLNRDGPKTFDCPKFVIESTDEIWNEHNGNVSWVKEKLFKYMTPDWESLSAFGVYIRGYEALEKLAFDTMTAFPDIQLHIIDTFCQGNDIDGYKTTMPVIHTATHLGWHPVMGRPTGKRLTWAGIPNTFIKKVNGEWKYTAEMNLPDMGDLYSQDGVWPARPQAMYKVNNCEQIFDWDTGSINRKFLPDNSIP